jgi:hypothetical protein
LWDTSEDATANKSTYSVNGDFKKKVKVIRLQSRLRDKYEGNELSPEVAAELVGLSAAPRPAKMRRTL